MLLAVKWQGCVQQSFHVYTTMIHKGTQNNSCDTIIIAAAVIGCVLCDTLVKSFASIDGYLSPLIQSWFTE